MQAKAMQKQVSSAMKSCSQPLTMLDLIPHRMEIQLKCRGCDNWTPSFTKVAFTATKQTLHSIDSPDRLTEPEQAGSAAMFPP